LEKLLGHFYYIDLILQDTPIYDDNYYEEITKIFPDSDEHGNRNLSQRKETTSKFIEYLSSEEKKDIKFKSNFTDDIIMFDVVNFINSTLSNDFKRLDNILNR
jgi:hypothetical protein